MHFNACSTQGWCCAHAPVLQMGREEGKGLDGVFFSKVLSIRILKSVDNVVVQPLWKSIHYLYAKSYLLGQWHNLG